MTWSRHLVRERVCLGFQFQEYKCPSWWGGLWQEQETESSYLLSGEKRSEQTGIGGSIFTFQAPPKLPQTVPPPGVPVFRCPRLWGTFPIKPPHGLLLLSQNHHMLSYFRERTSIPSQPRLPCTMDVCASRLLFLYWGLSSVTCIDLSQQQLTLFPPWHSG